MNQLSCPSPKLFERYPALQRPLRFGDPEQIEALAELQLDIEVEPYLDWTEGNPVPHGCKEFSARLRVADCHNEAVVVVAPNNEQAARVAKIVAERKFGGAPVVTSVVDATDKLRAQVASLEVERDSRRRAERRVHDLVNTLHSISAAGADYPRIQALVNEALDAISDSELNSPVLATVDPSEYVQLRANLA